MDLAGIVYPIVVDILFSWGRMLTALAASLLLGLAIGIWAARRRVADKIIIPIVDIFQTLPILAFFPFVIYIIVTSIPNAVGVNIGVVFLIVTGMLWNIIFGAYESIKALPEELVEVGKIYQMSPLDRLRKIYIPAAMPKAVEQSILSWSIGLFYLVTSEIFSTGSTTYVVKHGIGVALTNLASSGNYFAYGIGIGLFIVAVVLTRFLLFMPMEHYFNRYTQQHAPRSRLREAMKSIDVGYRLTKLNKFVHNIHVPAVHVDMHINVPVRKRKTFVPKSAHITRLSIEENRIARMAAYGVIIILLGILAGILAMTHRGILNYEYVVIVSLFASFARVWLAFAAGIAVAVPIGVYLIFMTKRSGWYLMLFQILSALPATILLPAIAYSLRNVPAHGEIVAFVIFFLSGLWYFIFSIVSNRVYIPQSVAEVKEIFGVKGINAWKNIYLKAILPGLITGSVTGIAAEWNASIVAERFTTTAIGSGSVISTVNVGVGKLLDLGLNTAGAPLSLMGVSLSSGTTLMIIGLLNLTIMIILVNRFVWKRLYRNALTAYK